MQRLSKFILFIFIIVSALQLSAATEDRSADEALVQRGLALLYEGVKPTTQSNLLLENALEFQKRFKLLTDGKNPVVTWKSVGAGTKQFSFDSLVQRPGHPANKVYGFLYEPTLPRFAEIQFPATLIIHHIADDIRPEQMIASMVANVRDSVTMVIYLPHYGARKDVGTFLTDDPVAFDSTIMQSLADIHQAGLILKSSKMAKPGRLQLMGISLGGIMTLMSAGVDGLFDSYLTFLGGGDLAHALSYPKEQHPDGEISKALKDVHANEEEGREMMSRFDPITWSYLVKGKTIVMLNAEHDELLPHALCVDKLEKAYRASGNKVESIFFKGAHGTPTEMNVIWDLAKKSFLPFRKFMTDAESGRKLQELKETN